MTGGRKISELATALKKKITGLDERIGKLQEEREQHAKDLAWLIAKYHPGDLLRKIRRRIEEELWLVEAVAPCRYGVLDGYVLHVRKLKKDGTPSKITTSFDSRWDLDKCTLVERRK